MSHKGIILFRAILREHKAKLPASMKILGDKYVANEFKLHKKTGNTEVLDQFYSEWNSYLNALKNQKGTKFGKDMTVAQVGVLNDDQKEKLQELRNETLTFTTQSSP
jgi:hypothetical protein